MTLTKKSNPRKAIKARAAKTQDEQITLQAQSDNGQKSPAIDHASEKLTVDTAPEMICEKFVAAIRSKDNRGWEKLLTEVAERHIRAANLEMQMPGGDRSTCNVGKATYNSARKNVAVVPCTIERIASGTTESFEISYLLKRETVGWRIAGFIVPTEEGTTDYLSFENADDVAQIKMTTEGTPEVASMENQRDYK